MEGVPVRWIWRRRSPYKAKGRTHKKQPKHYTPEEKVAILRRLLQKEPISNLCDQLGLKRLLHPKKLLWVIDAKVQTSSNGQRATFAPSASWSSLGTQVQGRCVLKVRTAVSKLPRATHDGRVQIGKWNVFVHVLDNGSRVLSCDSATEILEASNRKQIQQALDGWMQHPTMREKVGTVSLLDFANPIRFHPKAGRQIFEGYDSEVFVNTCKLILKARRFRLLQTTSDALLAAAAESLIVSLANVGLVALIDEATGFQKDRDRNALRELLDRYLKKEHALWAKRFPDDFYREMFRLKGWKWEGMNVDRPGIVGTYTLDIVYARMAPGLVRELERLNPSDGRGKRPNKHHQWLTDDVGHPALGQHLHAVIGLMRASTSWRGFNSLLKRAFPRKGDQLDLLDLEGSDLD